jgi:hypothetical protein
MLAPAATTYAVLGTRSIADLPFQDYDSGDRRISTSCPRLRASGVVGGLEDEQGGQVQAGVVAGELEIGRAVVVGHGGSFDSHV